MKLNKIDEVETVRIFGFLSSKILLPRQRDVMTSPLYWGTRSIIEHKFDLVGVDTDPQNAFVWIKKVMTA